MKQHPHPQGLPALCSGRNQDKQPGGRGLQPLKAQVHGLAPEPSPLVIAHREFYSELLSAALLFSVYLSRSSGVPNLHLWHHLVPCLKRKAIQQSSSVIPSSFLNITVKDVFLHEISW